MYMVIEMKALRKELLVTSVSIPLAFAGAWQRHQRQIMRLALRSLRLEIRQRGPRRGVRRSYNRLGQDFAVVTTRFSPAEYDTLHYAASLFRVSVSLLIYRMILLWLKPARRNRNPFVTNYELDICVCMPNAVATSESLLFWRKSDFEKQATPLLNLQNYRL